MNHLHIAFTGTGHISQIDARAAQAAASGAKLKVAHCWRFDSDVIWLKQHTAP